MVDATGKSNEFHFYLRTNLRKRYWFRTLGDVKHCETSIPAKHFHELSHEDFVLTHLTYDTPNVTGRIKRAA